MLTAYYSACRTKPAGPIQTPWLSIYTWMLPGKANCWHIIAQDASMEGDLNPAQLYGRSVHAIFASGVQTVRIRPADVVDSDTFPELEVVFKSGDSQRYRQSNTEGSYAQSQLAGPCCYDPYENV